MQNTGTLKKRKKRNLAKVTGLTTIPYNGYGDDFDGSDLFSEEKQQRHSIQSNTKNDCRINMSSFLHEYNNNQCSNSGRITRNPIFHDEYNDRNDFERLSTASSSCHAFTGVADSEQRSESINSRPCLFDKATINRLQQVLLMGVTSGAFPWYWNKKEYRIDRWSPFFEKLWKMHWFLTTIQTACLTVFQFYAFYTHVAGQHKTYREVFMNSVSLYWYIWAVLFNINMFFYKDQIREYVNTLLNFNKEYVEKYLIHMDGYKFNGRILISCSIPTCWFQIFSSVALFLAMPFQSWYLFSYIYPKPWYWLIPFGIQEYLKTAQVACSYMFTSWIAFGHTNSISFWMREVHNHYESDYTSDKLRQTKTALETYRALQILCTCFNECMSPLAIPLAKLHTISGLVPFGYILIRSMNHMFIDELPGTLSFPLGVFHTATVGFTILSMGAEMYDLAVSFTDSWCRTKHKNLRRILMSFPSLKIKVGKFYFVTVATTITFFKITFDLITDCIIAFP